MNTNQHTATPRTDAVTMDIVGDYDPEMLPYTDGDYVKADFARTRRLSNER